MEEIKEALYGYAMGNGALPCPDKNGDGEQDFASPATTPPSCDDVEGWLPWQTLGVDRGDAWGFRFRYRVTPEFTVANNLGCDDNNDGIPDNPDGNLDLCDKGDITVKSRGYDKPAVPPDLVTEIPAIVVSHGKNGRGATPAVGGAAMQGPEPTAVDERENLDGDPRFLTRHYTTDDPACDDGDPSKPYCAFDIVVWLSANVLKYRLVQAGRLP